MIFPQVSFESAVADPGIGTAPFFREDLLRNVFYDHSPSADSRKTVVSYKRKYVHDVLVNHLVKLALELCLPPGKIRRHIVFPLRPSVCPS